MNHRYKCLNCEQIVNLGFQFCPHCGVKFQENVFYRPHQQTYTQPNPEIKKHLENLSRFANFIINGANSKTKIQTLWFLANDKEKKEIAALIELGVENMLKQMEGYIHYPGFENYREAYGVCASEDGRGWMEEAFDTIEKFEEKAK